MEPGASFLLVSTVLLVAIAAGSVRMVPIATAGLVERLGRYRRTVGPGLTLVAPFLDRVRHVDMREQITTVDSLGISTDDARAIVSIVLYYQVTDPVRAVYEVADMGRAVTALTEHALRTALGTMTMHEAQTRRDQLAAAIQTGVHNGARTWGVEVTHVDIRSLDPAEPPLS